MKAAVFLAKGFEEIEAVSIIDVLRRGEWDVDTISVTGGSQVEGAHGITMTADLHFYDIDFSPYDMLILPGGMPGTRNLGEHEGLARLIKDFNVKGKWLGAICAAPSVLGKLGVLEGKEAICYPGFEPELKGCKVSDKDVVVSQNVITGKGAGVAIQFALEALTLDHPISYVQELSHKMIVPKYN